jgi:hypothetical protein
MQHFTTGQLAVGFAVIGMTLGCDRTPPSGPSPGPAQLRVLSVTPNTGTAGQETPIRVNGAGFESGATLSLDNVVVPSTFVSSAVITAVAPAHAAGAIDVAVTNPGGRASRLERGFTYVLRLVSLALSGNTLLTAVGETSQFTAVARFSDDSTRDVTLEAGWGSTQPQVATISPTGLLTAQALGSTVVSVLYPRTSTPQNPSLFRSTGVSISPPGTFAISGRVREPGAGGISGAEVRHVASGQTVITPPNGTFSMGGLTDGRLSVTKGGFEPVDLTADPSEFVDVPLQQVTRVEAGAPTLSDTLAPNDMLYEVAPGALCQPCRMIRVTSQTSGTIRVRVTWTDVASTMNLWLNQQLFAPTGQREILVDLPITGGVELHVYVGKIAGPIGNYVPYTFTVSPAG